MIVSQIGAREWTRRVVGEHYGRLFFITTWVVIIGVMALAPRIADDGSNFGTMSFLFWLVTLAAGMCVVSAVMLTYVAYKREVPELGFVSLWFLVLSVLPLVHGITAPGVLYGPNEAFNSAVFLAGPLGAVAGLPIIARGWIAARIAREWHRWYSAGALLLVSLAAVMLISPNAISTPATTSRWAILTAIPTAALAATYSWRHLQFARVSGQPRYLVIFFAFAFTGVANLVWLSPAPFGPTFWFAHVFEVVGVFLGTLGAVLVFRRYEPTSRLLGPILTADPLVALDLGLDPAVDAYIKLLDSKDTTTRDHAVRTAEAGVKVAAAMSLSAKTIRDVGIAGVLHDIGKLGIPNEVLAKPGKLTEDEFELMKTHTTLGYELLRSNPGLRTVAPLVLSHHERIDGLGYPNGSRGDEIPLASQIVSVCDAFDAMTQDRPYRSGMGSERAIALLRENAGSQWNEQVVKVLVGLVEKQSIAVTPTVLDHLGQRQGENQSEGAGSPIDDEILRSCLSALPSGAEYELQYRTG